MEFNENRNNIPDKSKLTIIKKRTQLKVSHIENKEESNLQVNEETKKTIQSMKQNCSSSETSNIRLKSISNMSSQSQSQSKPSTIPTSNNNSNNSNSNENRIKSISSQRNNSVERTTTNPSNNTTNSSTGTTSKKLVIQWTCDECNNSCIPVRSESRCLW